MKSETDDSKNLRLRAAELRALADESKNAASRDVFLGLAGTYDRLAEQTEERLQRRRHPAGKASAQEIAKPPAPSPRVAVREHKFKVGETVSVGPPAGGLLAAPVLFRIIHLVPNEGAEHQYWVKSIADGQERIAKESELHPGDARPADKAPADKAKA